MKRGNFFYCCDVVTVPEDVVVPYEDVVRVPVPVVEPVAVPVAVPVPVPVSVVGISPFSLGSTAVGSTPFRP